MRNFNIRLGKCDVCAKSRVLNFNNRICTGCKQKYGKNADSNNKKIVEVKNRS